MQEPRSICRAICIALGYANRGCEVSTWADLRMPLTYMGLEPFSRPERTDPGVGSHSGVGCVSQGREANIELC